MKTTKELLQQLADALDFLAVGEDGELVEVPLAVETSIIDAMYRLVEQEPDNKELDAWREELQIRTGSKEEAA